MCVCLSVCVIRSVPWWWSRNAPSVPVRTAPADPPCAPVRHPRAKRCPSTYSSSRLLPHPPCFPVPPLTHRTRAAATWCHSLTGRRGGGLPWSRWVSHTHRTRTHSCPFICVCCQPQTVALRHKSAIGSAAAAALALHWWSVDTQRHPRSGWAIWQVLHGVSGIMLAPESGLIIAAQAQSNG